MRSLRSNLLIQYLLAGMSLLVIAGGAQAGPDQARAVYSVDGFVGATAGDKIAACIAALPSTGGVCDARTLPSGGTIPGFTISRSGVTILGPCGKFTVSGQIQFYNPSSGIQQVNWQGCGAGYSTFGTQFSWSGNGSDPLFHLIGVRDSEFQDFHINATKGAPLSAAFQLETQTGQSATNRHFRNIIVEGTNGGVTKGFRWCSGDNCGGAGPDANNDLDTLINVEVSNYSIAAFSIEHGQSKSHHLIRDTCNSDGFGQYCVYALTGSFVAIGMAGGGNQISDFYLGTPDDTVVIESCNLEGSNRLLLTGGSASPWPVSIIGCRWGADKLNADNNVISYSHRGPLNLIGNIIDSPHSGASPAFNLSPGGGRPVLGIAAGNAVFWSAATNSSNPFTGTVGGGWELLGNLIDDANGDLYKVPDSVVSGVSCSGAPTINFASVNGIVTHC
jgi:hypothetical protein